MSSTLRGQRRRLQWRSYFARKPVENSLSGEASACAEKIGRVAFLRQSYATFADLSPGMTGFEPSERLFTRLRRETTVAETFLARHFLGTQQTLHGDKSDHVYCVLCTEKQADGTAKVERRMVLVLRMIQSG